jgi:methylated-DNA-protein-cysteine methyltransferase related protein
MALKKKEEAKEYKKDHYFQRVYDVTSLVPYGRVTTYGAIADFLGLGSARMVGWALNHCHAQDYIVPAHRVVNRKGELSGRLHFQTPTLMQDRLVQEGVEIADHKVIKMDEKFWHPRELDGY